MSPIASAELKMDEEMKSLLNRIPENMSDRLAEVERVLIEICDREGIAFNIEQPNRERVLRNVKAD